MVCKGTPGVDPLQTQVDSQSKGRTLVGGRENGLQGYPMQASPKSIKKPLFQPPSNFKL